MHMSYFTYWILVFSGYSKTRNFLVALAADLRIGLHFEADSEVFYITLNVKYPLLTWKLKSEKTCLNYILRQFFISEVP